MVGLGVGVMWWCGGSGGVVVVGMWWCGGEVSNDVCSQASGCIHKRSAVS